MKYLHVTKF